MFPTPWNTLPDFAAHNWPPHQGEQSLSELARRIIDLYSIRDGDIVIGASLGGMVGCEVAKLRRLRALVLVGSATHSREISHLLAALHTLADRAPLEWIRAVASQIPGDLAQMLGAAEASFIRAMCPAIFAWNGLGDAPVRCLRIHGRADRVIPPPARVELLLDAGHLLSMTHARECAEFVRSIHQGSAGPGPEIPA